MLTPEIESILIPSIKNHEGLRLVKYKDSLGIDSIGYGHKILPKENYEVITEEFANTLLRFDINFAVNETIRNFNCYNTLNPARKAILIEMVYQMGAQGVSKFVNMLQDLSCMDYKLAAKDMLKSNWAKETPDRAKNLALRMQNG